MLQRTSETLYNFAHKIEFFQPELLYFSLTFINELYF